MLLVVDFGGQTAHLITRRLKELGAVSQFVTPEELFQNIEKYHPEGIILSGGPMSVYAPDAPTVDKKLFSMGIPLLGICYGMQLNAHLGGGEVVSGRKEYGPATLELTGKNKLPIAKGLPQKFTIWMSHGDEVLSMPSTYEVLGSTATVPYAFVADEKRKIYGIQFHPEAEHTENGMQILKNFLDICGVELKEETHDISQMIESIKQTVGDAHVIGAVSGGVDSTVAGVLVAKAIGKQFTPVFVNNGLMRDDAVVSVVNLFKRFEIKPIIVNVEEEMLTLLKGITDSEEKRKVIGKFYIEVFEREMKKLATEDTDVQFLLQGTIYSDVIESQGTKHASKIKSHHNVGGLPEQMKLKLLEPLRSFYKDEVRQIGRNLGLPDEFVQKQTFPGPGYAVRIRGEVTAKRLAQEKHADTIIMEELHNAGLLKNIFMSFPVMTGATSTAVKGDEKFMGEVIALRVVESKDIMTATWSYLPYEILQRISSRIVNEVPHIARVVYDITTKPPATMEWE